MNVLGIDFGGTKVALRAEAAGGSALEERLRIGADESATSVLSRAFDAARRLVDSVGVLDAVGISTPGVVLDDRVDLAPNVIGWSELDLGARLRSEFGVSALAISNDVKAAALAECREGALRGSSVALYVNLGTGIAIAPIIDGEVLHGAHGAAGEVGYGIVGPVSDWSASSPTLEEFAGGRGLSRRVAADDGISATDAAGLVSEAGHSEPASRMWLEAVDEIARHLATAILTIDPARIAIGGGMIRAGDALLQPLRARLAEALPYPPELVLSEFGPDASLRGAVILARTAR
ncbi:glucokinase [Microbacterium sp. W4I4]|uniref:ROK family protein n=1 Tax=Microbacterium sp. W4I4 TaxID=3042295 RepID=UPI0027820E40|nr:ROK family protein [Microbacterium sp. W4I4]MDQ0614752.1 glucokinase [Microbacterium sp. W4I4]